MNKVENDSSFIASDRYITEEKPKDAIFIDELDHNVTLPEDFEDELREVFIWMWPGVDREELQEWMNFAGEVESVDLLTRHGQNTGMAYVRYETHDFAKACVDALGSGDNEVRAQWSESERWTKRKHGLMAMEKNVSVGLADTKVKKSPVRLLIDAAAVSEDQLSLLAHFVKAVNYDLDILCSNAHSLILYNCPKSWRRSDVDRFMSENASKPEHINMNALESATEFTNKVLITMPGDEVVANAVASLDCKEVWEGPQKQQLRVVALVDTKKPTPKPLPAATEERKVTSPKAKEVPRAKAQTKARERKPEIKEQPQAEAKNHTQSTSLDSLNSKPQPYVKSRSIQQDAKPIPAAQTTSMPAVKAAIERSVEPVGEQHRTHRDQVGERRAQHDSNNRRDDRGMRAPTRRAPPRDVRDVRDARDVRDSERAGREQSFSSETSDKWVVLDGFPGTWKERELKEMLAAFAPLEIVVESVNSRNKSAGKAHVRVNEPARLCKEFNNKRPARTVGPVLKVYQHFGPDRKTENTSARRQPGATSGPGLSTPGSPRGQEMAPAPMRRIPESVLRPEPSKERPLINSNLSRLSALAPKPSVADAHTSAPVSSKAHPKIPQDAGDASRFTSTVTHDEADVSRRAPVMSKVIATKRPPPPPPKAGKRGIDNEEERKKRARKEKTTVEFDDNDF